MRTSGLAHLLAISGLHVGLVTGIVFFLMRAVLALIGPLAVRYPLKKWAAAGAILGAAGYTVMAGATVPTQRAFLMVSLVLVAVMLDRRAMSLRSVGWAAMVILVFAPESLLGASFQLSFAAVVALIAVYEGLRNTRWFKPKPGSGWMTFVGRYILTVAITTLVAGLSTSIFAAFHFNRVAEYSLAANLVAVPITALWVMPFAVVSYILMPLGLEAFALTPMGWGIDLVLKAADTVAHWPGSVRMVAAFPVWGIVMVSLGGLWLAIWKGGWRYGGIGGVMIGLSALAFVQMPHVLVDATGSLAAVRTPTGGYVVSTLRAKKFEQGIWLRRAGLDQAQGSWMEIGAHNSPLTKQQSIANTTLSPDGTIAPQNNHPPQNSNWLRCDALGCVYQNDHQTVAFVWRAESLSEDCQRARVVFNVNKAKDVSTPSPCAAEVFITAKDLNQFGAHALYFEPSNDLGEMPNIRIETVKEKRGDRPWVVGAIPSENNNIDWFKSILSD